MASGERERMHRGEADVVVEVAADAPARTGAELHGLLASRRTGVPPLPEIRLRAPTSWLRRR